MQGDKIGLLKFCEIRPQNVKLLDHLPCLLVLLSRECEATSISFKQSHEFECIIKKVCFPGYL